MAKYLVSKKIFSGKRQLYRALHVAKEQTDCSIFLYYNINEVDTFAVIDK